MPQKDNTFLTFTGKIRYTMTNDYMFRAILQKNQKVLRGLVSSLLHKNLQKAIIKGRLCPIAQKKLHGLDDRCSSFALYENNSSHYY